MHLFDKARPEASPGVKALLGDGSAVPHIIVMPIENGKVQLLVWLRNYEVGSTYTYSQYEAELDLFELQHFFDYYAGNPEETIEHYFHWTPQTINKSTPPTPRLPLNAESMSLKDLL